MKNIIYNILTIILFFIICYFAFQTIHEIITRESFVQFLKSKMNQSEHRLLDYAEEQDSTGFDQENIIYQFYKQKLNQVSHLIKLGGGYRETSITILRYEIDQFISKESTKSKFNTPYYAKILDIIFLASNEMLIILIVFLFGAIGAMISIMINGMHLRIRRLFVGISASIISFVTIKSGIFIFVDTFYENSNMINPYSITVISLLSGLFTDRVFKFVEEKFKLNSKSKK